MKNQTKEYKQSSHQNAGETRSLDVTAVYLREGWKVYTVVPRSGGKEF